MNFEEMMSLVVMFRSWPRDVQAYCAKIVKSSGCSQESACHKAIPKSQSIGNELNYRRSWSQEDSDRLIHEVTKSPVQGKHLWNALAAKYGRSPKALQSHWEKTKRGNFLKDQNEAN